ncbi:uncharacterized protein IL334_002227 [Kwoniella shivajii]|uniref:Beta-xylanase n=1 Tax=Kwoniella shivajii TaxID=564305 RepID=A0ABZ1CVT2_9TREE|nr:hypothetical protein IL334_002227 [Kwoniella shivajii]
MLKLLAYALLCSQVLASPVSPRWSSDQCQSSPLRSLAQANIQSVHPENEMKWEVIEPQRGVFNWTEVTWQVPALAEPRFPRSQPLQVIAKAKEVGGIVRGHNFCWDQQTPTYVTNITDPDELKTVLKEHIDAVLGRYKNDLYAMDIINEPLNDNGTIKASVWYDVLGEDYLAVCLQYARDAAPNLKLYINDYNIEAVNNKSIALASIVSGLKDQGVPIDGVGFESHFVGGEVPTTLQASMKQFTDMGLDVAITELDVRVPVNNSGLPTLPGYRFKPMIMRRLSKPVLTTVIAQEKPALGSISSTLASGFNCGNGDRK